MNRVMSFCHHTMLGDKLNVVGPFFWGGGKDVNNERAYEVHHDSEDSLLHLSCVLGAEDDHLAAAEVEGHGGARGHALDGTVAGEAACVVDGEVGFAEVGKLVSSRADKHVGHEQCVVRTRAHNADLQAVRRVPSREGIHHEDALLHVQVVDRTLAVKHELRLLLREVDRAPPHVVLGGGLHNDTLVLRATAGLETAVGSHRAGVGDDGSLLVLQGVLVQLRDRCVLHDLLVGLDAHVFKVARLSTTARVRVEAGRCGKVGSRGHGLGDLLGAVALFLCLNLRVHRRNVSHLEVLFVLLGLKG